MAKKFRSSLEQFSRSIWLFPVLLLFPLILFTSLKISGSSVGMYNSILYGDTQEDPNLLYGHPRSIRSDEWLVNTQLIIAQESNDYQRINTNIGYGQDVSLTGDAPYREWSVVFRPHNLAFFVLPLENAFAFKWWVMAYLLLVSCYLFVLTLLKDRRLLASLVAIALFCSPFVQWWYIYGTLGSIYYALFSAIILTKIINAKRTRPRLLWSGLLAYVLVCFALILYPPFQISCALAVLAFFAGYLLDVYTPKRKREIMLALVYISGAVLLAGLTVLIFLNTRSEAIEAIRNTIYPGKRESVSGGLNGLHVFGNQLSPLLQSDTLGSNYHTNQSEASGFILVFPFLSLLSAYLLIKRWLSDKKIDWLLLLTSVGLIAAMARVFLPGFNVLYRPFLLSMVPQKRLLIGVGLLSFIHILALIRHWQLFKPKRNVWVIGISTLTAFVVFYHSGMYVLTNYPLFLSQRIWVIAAALAMAMIVFLMCAYKFTWALLALVSFSIFSVYKVNPLYRGLGVPLHSEIAQQIATTADRDDGVWVVSGFLINENLTTANGARTFTGVQLYPQLELWREADPEGKYSHVYNRYAHVSTTFNHSEEVSFNLTGLDNFQVGLNPCGSFAESHDVDFVLTSSPIDFSCLQLIDLIEYPSMSFYIYENPDVD